MAFIEMGINREKVSFWFRLNSNMSNISFVMGMFSYQNQLNRTVGTLIFDGFQKCLDHLPYFLV